MGAQFRPLFECLSDLYERRPRSGRRVAPHCWLPSSGGRASGADMAWGSPRRAAEFPSRMHISFVCLLGIWHLGIMLTPLWDGKTSL